MRGGREPEMLIAKLLVISLAGSQTNKAVLEESSASLSACIIQIKKRLHGLSNWTDFRFVPVCGTMVSLLFKFDLHDHY